jgi:hypothetical protein
VIVLHGDDKDLARVNYTGRRGLLAWLYGDGVLLVPPGLRLPQDGEEDPLAVALLEAATRPVDP